MLFKKEWEIIFKIGVLGYNYDQSCKALYKIANNDEFKPKSISQFVALMNDDIETLYISLNPNNEDGVRGTNLNQLILVDDWRISYQHYEYINDCVKPCLVRS